MRDTKAWSYTRSEVHPTAHVSTSLSIPEELKVRFDVETNTFIIHTSEGVLRKESRKGLGWKVAQSYQKFPILSGLFNISAIFALLGLLIMMFTNSVLVNPYILILVVIGSVTMSLVILTAVGEIASEKK